MADALPVSPADPSAEALAKADPPAPRKRSQKRHRRHQRIGVFDDREVGLFDAAYERYRGSAAADAYGDSVAAFVRYMTIGEGARKLPPRRVNPDLPRDLVSLLGGLMTELLRIGNNLNQIAHHMNAGRAGHPAYVQAVHEELRETMRAAQRMMGWEE